ncbi:hypothetical protein BC938DRAFT_472125 [Jimgerdemannia flammicorona]|uniref:Uncharacterized protein n=1 Tax=Jimgerdemannia flammicorona TaxID=994334 RepID=A0A433Q6S2_9FUNG|nr:hypothetical protein BC938DRAFT_472125 [Jimgerdemannia flammicorona]
MRTSRSAFTVLQILPPKMREVNSPGYWYRHPLKSLAIFGQPLYSEPRWIGYCRIAFSMLFCFALLGTIVNGIEQAITGKMSVQQSTVKAMSVLAPEIVICPATNYDFDFSFDCGFLDAQGEVQWYNDNPNHCPNISLIPTVNENIHSVTSSRCYLVQPRGVVLNSKVTGYYLVINFTDPTTGTVLDDEAFMAYAYFFHPSYNLSFRNSHPFLCLASNIIVNNDTKLATDENPFLQDLIRPVMITPQRKFFFDFNQIEWDYLENEEGWLGKTGLPFAPRRSVTLLDFTIQSTRYNSTNYDGLSVITITADPTKKSNRLLHSVTVQSVVSSIGGLFCECSTLVAGLYLIIFGAKRLNPWGLAHVIPVIGHRVQYSVVPPQGNVVNYTGSGGGDVVLQRLHELEVQMQTVRNHFLYMDDFIPETVASPSSRWR